MVGQYVVLLRHLECRTKAGFRHRVYTSGSLKIDVLDRARILKYDDSLKYVFNDKRWPSTNYRGKPVTLIFFYIMLRELGTAKEIGMVFTYMNDPTGYNILHNYFKLKLPGKYPNLPRS
ncbi:hypothetical protein N7530_006809 [Penicillium desertorum]|uniref:Uncharacterized protein n=1 Tax=Penicillium desertorum TaxID=1303715 RepID=A0A9X0BMU3_9EURO|nr:hypothetical protein N7530_006809 [Penicillium desertorum]